jgi:glutamine amidotransferase
MIVVLDYGLGNLASVVNMIARANGKATVSRNSADLVSATKIVLSGVGAFDHGMTTLRAGGWIEALDRAVL